MEELLFLRNAPEASRLVYLWRKKKEQCKGALAMSYDPETRPSVGKDVPQDPRGAHPAPAPDNMRQGSRPPPANAPNPDPGYPDQTAMNQQNPDQQQNRGERPRVQQPDEATRKAEIRKAVEEDQIDSKTAQGQEKTGTSAGP